MWLPTRLSELLAFMVVGAVAQLVDGALGMAFGVTSSGLLLALGLPPVAASASVHYAEAFTCGASGLSHLLAGNVRRALFLALVIPGVLGALIGVWIAVHVPPSWLRAMLAPYQLGMGGFLLLRCRRPAGTRLDVPRGTGVTGGIAGLVDAIGGGGWSAITVTTLLARRSQFHQNVLISRASNYDFQFRDMVRGLSQSLSAAGSTATDATSQAYHQIYLTIQRQASILSYIDTVWIFGIASALMVPLAFLMKRPKPGARAVGH